ncbi:MAG: polysaccharide deacetylase [Magnetococcales bacterium]|nr:polysaccharide deacetylase [Magnetococcales bacterium]
MRIKLDNQPSPPPQSPIMKILFTIDVETWPVTTDPETFGDYFERCIFGRVGDGAWGLSYQLDIFRQYDLQAVFFVEPLFAGVMGLGFLERIVSPILAAGHDIQLHTHPEWLSQYTPPLLPSKTPRHRMHDYAEGEQVEIIEQGLKLLKKCGVDQVQAFRAGSFGADDNTLKTLSQTAITMDSSFNPGYPECRITPPRSSSSNSAPPSPWQPVRHHGILEFPMGGFSDWPGHTRHLQLTAVSTAEMTGMIEQAYEKKWRYLVILSHSFELLNRSRSRKDPIMVRRFEALCQFLANNRQRFQTIGFADIDPQAWSNDTACHPPLTSHPLRTLHRMGEQLFRRVYAP